MGFNSVFKGLKTLV